MPRSEMRVGNGDYQAPNALLSCQSCRRRKVRCDKELPSCSLCVKSSQNCTYPAGPLKPGPKLGSSQRSVKRPRRTKEDDSDQVSDNHQGHDEQQQDIITHHRTNSWQPDLSLTGQSTTWPHPPLIGSESTESSHVVMSEHSHHSPESTCSTVATRSDSNSINLPTLSSIIHPSHESAGQALLGDEENKDITTPVYGDEVCSKSAKKVMISQALEVLHITKDIYCHL